MSFIYKSNSFTCTTTKNPGNSADGCGGHVVSGSVISDLQNHSGFIQILFLMFA